MPEHQFPRSQRELVSLALQRGCRRAAAPAGADSQRDRVRQALALGVGTGAKSGAPRAGIRR
jgi:hypothetical protein